MEIKRGNDSDERHVSQEIVDGRKRGVYLRSGCCQECGKAVSQLGTGRTMKYCSDACRMKAYRVRKAGTKPVKSSKAELRIAELESRVLELESENQRLRKEVVIEVWENADGQCQASSKTGERCRNHQGLKIVTSEHGKAIAFAVCPSHYRKFEALNGRLRPHSSMST